MNIDLATNDENLRAARRLRVSPGGAGGPPADRARHRNVWRPGRCGEQPPNEQRTSRPRPQDTLHA